MFLIVFHIESLQIVGFCRRLQKNNMAIVSWCDKRRNDRTTLTGRSVNASRVQSGMVWSKSHKSTICYIYHLFLCFDFGKTYCQVVLDVNRSLKRFPPGIPYEQRVALQDQLTVLILRVIIMYPHLKYYQVSANSNLSSIASVLFHIFAIANNCTHCITSHLHMQAASLSTENNPKLQIVYIIVIPQSVNNK